MLQRVSSATEPRPEEGERIAWKPKGRFRGIGEKACQELYKTVGSFTILRKRVCLRRAILMVKKRGK